MTRTTWTEETTPICEPWFQLCKSCLSQSCSPLYTSSKGKTKKPRSPKTPLFKSYLMAGLTGATGWETWLGSVFLKAEILSSSKGKLFYIQWFQWGWEGLDLDQNVKQNFPQADPPHLKGTQKHLPTTSNICLQLETTAKPSSPGSLYEWRTNALIWIYKNLHPIWGQPM